MKLTDEQYSEIRRKLANYLLEYSIRYTKNVVHRYVTFNNTPTIGKTNEMPDVAEFMGILTNEPQQ